MIPYQLRTNCLALNPVGSRTTCNPPPTDTDEDWLVLVSHNQMQGWLGISEQCGFTLDNPSEHYAPEQSTFNSWRSKDNVNLIITCDDVWHKKFLLATSLAKIFNLMDKEDRKRLFQAVLYGVDFDNTI